MQKPSKYRLARTWTRADSVHAIAISPDGRYLACSSNDHQIAIYDLSVGMLLREYATTDRAVALKWGDDGGQLFVACLRGQVFMYRGTTSSRVGLCLIPLLRPTHQPGSYSWSPTSSNGFLDGFPTGRRSRNWPTFESPFATSRMTQRLNAFLSPTNSE